MFTGATESAVYNLKAQTRCLAWVPVDEESEADKQHLLVGTASVHERNQITVLEYTQSTNDTRVAYVLPHDGDIVDMSPSTKNPDLLATCSSPGVVEKAGPKATIWRLRGLPTFDGTDSGADEEASGSAAGAGAAGAGAGAGAGDGDGDGVTLVKESAIPEQDSGVVRVIWNPHRAGSLASVHKKSFTVHTFKAGAVSVQGTVSLGDERANAYAASWDPLHSKECVAAVGTGLVGIDVRSMKETVSIPHAHKTMVRDVDYNPNKPRFVASCGDDCSTRFWDLRKSAEPVKVLSGHSHWVWSVAYNRFHDQLVLSSSSDALVSLWRVSSISSAPLLELDDSSGEKSVADTLVKRYEEHEDSVYKVDWSYASAWVFASLSFSGRVSISHVPPPEMYKILL